MGNAALATKSKSLLLLCLQNVRNKLQESENCAQAIQEELEETKNGLVQKVLPAPIIENA